MKRTAAELPLFRPEVSRARAGSPLGTIVIGRPLSATVISGAALAIVVAMLLFLYFGRYTRRIRLTGTLTPAEGVARIYPPRSGVVAEIRIRDGAEVKRGDTLMVISMPQESRRGDVVAQVLATIAARQGSLRAERSQIVALAAIERAELARRLNEVRLQSESLAGEAALLAERLLRTRQTVDKHKELARLGLISATSLSEKEDQQSELQTRALALQRSRAQVEGERTAIAAQLEAVPLNLAARIAELDRAILELDQQLRENESRADVIVRAPVGGTATMVLARAGQTANPAIPLLSIIPSDSVLEAHLLAPGAAIAHVKPGQRVRLRYDAFPHQKFGQAEGHVASVSRTGTDPAGAETGYRVIVDLAAQTMAGQPLLPDMRVEADVELDRRRLIEWLLAPLYEPLFDRS